EREWLTKSSGLFTLTCRSRNQDRPTTHPITTLPLLLHKGVRFLQQLFPHPRTAASWLGGQEMGEMGTEDRRVDGTLRESDDVLVWN
ncbi:unnamed protein product, partial [Musa acuminata var. zebrina]